MQLRSSVSALKAIGINDFGTPITMYISENTLEVGDGGSTADELLDFLGPFCLELTESVRQSSNPDTHESLIEALKQHGMITDDIELMDGCNYGDAHVGSISIQFYIVIHKSDAWVAIETVSPGGWSPCVSGAAVFKLNDPGGFHDYFSTFPGIAAICDGKRYIAESDECCRGLNDKFMIDVSKLTSDANGNIFMDKKPVTFVFGGV